MQKKPSTYFDERAKTWDDDPTKTARAEVVAAGIRAQVPLAAGMIGLEYGCGTGLLSFMPVSYTHLDVYKRQRQSRSYR